MKKLFTLFIAVFAAIGLLAQTSGTCGDNLNWSYNETTKTLTITGSGAMNSYASDSVVPWVNVREEIETVSLPNGLLTIGDRAFRNCKHLSSINIPASVDTIGKYAFYHCEVLPSIVLPSNLHALGSSVFMYCYAMDTIVIPGNITVLPTYIFGSCTGLKSVTLPEGLTTISSYAFYKCSSLKSIIVPESVTTIGHSAFRQMRQLESISLPDGLTEIKQYTFQLDSSLTTIKWPANLKTIGDYTFSTCISLTSVTLPDGLETLGNYTFNRCSTLTTVNVPESLTKVNGATFSECPGLTTPIFNSHLFVKLPVSYVGEFCIPEGIRVINRGALHDCAEVTAVTLPTTLDSIAYGAFTNTVKLKHANILSPTPAKVEEGEAGFWPNRVKFMIPFGAWSAYSTADYWSGKVSYFKEGYYTNGLYYKLNSTAKTAQLNYLSTSNVEQASYVSGILNVPENLNISGVPYTVNAIGNAALLGCTAMTEITLPASIDTLYARCFKNCGNLYKITMLADHPAILKDDNGYTEHFDGTSNPTFYVPAAHFNSYKQSTYWVAKTIVQDKIRPIEDVELFTVTFYHRSQDYGTDYTGDGNEIRFSSLCEGYFTQKVVAGQPAIEPEPLYPAAHANYPWGPIPTGYTFVGWEEDFSAVTANMKIHTKYMANPYTVTFKNYNDTVLEEALFEYGTVPSYSKGTPHRDTDAEFSYIFVGWFSSATAQTVQVLPEVTGNVTYTAVYSQVDRQYTITFEDGNGNVLQQSDWQKNVVPVYSGETPAKEGLEFYGWSPELLPATADATYTPVFRARIIFNDEWGHEWQNSLWELGATPVYSGETPYKDADAQYTYTFSKWPTISPATTGTTYTAVFDKTLRKYRIAFFNGEQLLQDEQLEYGTMPEYKGEDLTYTAEGVKYNHVGWTPELHAVTGEQFYYARFSEVARHFVIFYDCDGITELQKGYVEEGQDAVAPTESQQAGSIITGWDKDFTNVQSDLYVYAECVLEKYTVSLSAENGSIAVTDESSNPVDLSQPVEYGTVLTLVATADEGFVFDQWSDAHAENTRHITVTGDITLSALFKVRTLQVVFVDWDDSILKEAQTVNYGEAAIAPADPVREGYTFTGWDKDFSAVTEDMTIKAQYEQAAGLEDILGGNVQSTKVLIDGVLYILRPDGMVYNAQGAEVR